MGVHSAAGLSVAKSALPWRMVPKSETPNVFVHMSKPPSPIPKIVPNRDHDGLALRTFQRSRPMAQVRHPASYSLISSLARPDLMACATCSAASKPDSIAL